ncbi:hypothetical protein GCM10020220_003840 [Nonomuraea rubra]
MGAGAEVDVVVDDRAVQERALADDRVVAEHGVLAQLGARLHLGVFADEQRALEHGVGVHRGRVRHPDARGELEAAEVQLDLAGQGVGLGLEVAVVGADVLPVAVGDVAVDGGAALQEGGEHVGGPVDGLAGRDGVEDLGFHDVDAGVDGVGEDLAPGGFLQEALYAALVVHDDDPEFERVRDAFEADRDKGAIFAVKTDHVG